MSTFSTSSPPLKDSFLRSHHISKIGCRSPDETGFLGWRHAVYFPYSSWNVVDKYSGGRRSLTEHWAYFYSAVSARSRQQQLQPLAHYKPAGSLFWSVLIWQFSHGGFRFNITFPNLLLSTQTNVYFWMVWTIFACFVWINSIFHHYAFIHSLTCCSTFSGKSLFWSSFVSIVFIVYVEKLT